MDRIDKLLPLSKLLSSTREVWHHSAWWRKSANESDSVRSLCVVTEQQSIDGEDNYLRSSSHEGPNENALQLCAIASRAFLSVD